MATLLRFLKRLAAFHKATLAQDLDVLTSRNPLADYDRFVFYSRQQNSL